MLDASKSPVLDAINEDPGAPSGAVGTQVPSLVDFPGGGGLDNVTDPDAGPVTGIAVTAADTADGAVVLFDQRRLDLACPGHAR